MGPVTLFDKSFLQSLSLDESVFFDHFFLPVICPVFYVETLADLEKVVRRGRTPEQEVGIIANKVPEMSGGPCAFHGNVATADMFGHGVPMDGRIPTAGGRAVRVDGKSGVAHELSPESEAFSRWQNREFLYVERNFARTWRSALNAVDLVTFAAGMKALGIDHQTCKSLADAKKIVDEFLRRGGRQVPYQIKLAMVLLGVPLELEAQVLERWRERGGASFTNYAPYAAHVLAVELFFQIALAANLIGTTNPANRTDIAYLFYAPFCHVFVSSDNLHRRCAPHFLRANQSFVWGHDLKADLHHLIEHYKTLPQEEREKGLINFARIPPPDDKESLVVRLWDRHLLPTWRERLSSAQRPRDAEEDKKLVEHINKVSTAKPLPANEVDFAPEDAEFVQITHRVSKRRGSWWQLPRDLKSDESG
jgi:hypothetical protein